MGSGSAVAADLARNARDRHRFSIRIPACFAVTGSALDGPRADGVVAVSRSFDTVGPIANSAEDCSLLLQALAPSYRPEHGGAGGLRIGVVSQLFERAEPDVAACVQAAVEELGALGAQVEPVTIPLLEEAGTIVQTTCSPGGGAHLDWLHAAARLRCRRPCAPARWHPRPLT